MHFPVCFDGLQAALVSTTLERHTTSCLIIGSDVFLFSLNYNRTGRILLELDMPTNILLGEVYGGPNQDMLIVSTASVGPDPTSGASVPADDTEFAGKLYQVTGLGRGYAGGQFRLD